MGYGAGYIKGTGGLIPEHLTIQTGVYTPAPSLGIFTYFIYTHDTFFSSLSLFAENENV